MGVAKDELLTKVVRQVQKFFGERGAPVVAVQFASSFYLKHGYYEELQKRGYSDIEGATYLILITSTQVFLSMYDLINGLHLLECTEEPNSKEIIPVANEVQQLMETFLHNSIMSAIRNARRLEIKFDWRPDILPLMIEVSLEMFNRIMSGLKSVGHDCNNCHIYKDKKECEIYDAIPKPIGYREDTEPGEPSVQGTE